MLIPNRDPNVIDAYAASILATPGLSETERYNTYCLMATNYLSNRRSIEALRLVASAQTAAELPSELYAKLQHHVAVTLYVTGRFFAAEAYVSKLTEAQANAARVESMLMCGLKPSYAALILTAVTDAALRTKLTLGRQSVSQPAAKASYAN